MEECGFCNQKDEKIESFEEEIEREKERECQKALEREKMLVFWSTICYENLLYGYSIITFSATSFRYNKLHLLMISIHFTTTLNLEI